VGLSYLNENRNLPIQKLVKEMSVTLNGPYLVIGSRGMLGTDLLDLLVKSGRATVGLDLDQVDIADSVSVKTVMDKYRPSVVINAAALTDVDGCESKSDLAFRVNGEGPANLAKAARDREAYLVHLSTDYVFDGKKRAAYLEDDLTHPLGVYAKSKALGELRIRDALPDNHCIVRTQWLFGIHGRNFVETILSLAKKQKEIRVVNDQHGSPTYSPDLSGAILTLCDKRARGTVHVTNSGETTWYDFAARIVERAGLGVPVASISSEELKRPAPRPAYAVLDKTRFVSISGRPLRNWEEALDDYLGKRKNRM
jgi:dTDP-4-dehydrorhamnose reductase